MSSLPGIIKELQQQFAEHPQLAAQKILDEYFSFYDAHHVQEELWDLTHGTVTNQLLDTQTAMDRHNHLFFYEYSKLFISAVYYLHGKTLK